MMVLMLGLMVALIRHDGSQPLIRLVATAEPPDLVLEEGYKWALFLSHTWASAQDQCAVIKRQLTRMLPGISIFLDVDDLDDINNLDEWIARSVVLLLFASDKYFTSWSCQNEIKSSLKWKRPFFLVHEADPKHGGKPWADLVAECPLMLEASDRFGALPEEYLTAKGEGDVNRWALDGWFARAPEAPTRKVQLEFAKRIFDGQEPIMWHRLPDFQQIALKGIAGHVLKHSPEFLGQMEVPLYIPGELLRQKLDSTSAVVLYVSEFNRGAAELAAELQAVYPSITITSDLQSLSSSTGGAPTHFVLYLNFNTFADEDGLRLAEQVRLAMASELPIVLPHEHDPIKSGCQFERFFTTTPPDLIRDGLFKKLALPCFPGSRTGWAA